MAILVTFNIGDSSLKVEEDFEEPSDLRTNPLQKGRLIQSKAP